MTLNFNKLMQEAKRNWQDAKGKTTELGTPNGQMKADQLKNSKPTNGPNPNAIQAFLAKQKLREQEELKRKEDEKRRILAARAKEIKRQPKPKEEEHSKPKIKNKLVDIRNDEEKRSLERRKAEELAMQVAKQKFQANSQSKPSTSANKSYTINGVMNGKPKRQDDVSNSKCDTSSAKKINLSNFKIPSVKISQKEPVDFAKLMTAASKNRDPQLFEPDTQLTTKYKKKRKLSRDSEPPAKRSKHDKSEKEISTSNKNIVAVSNGGAKKLISVPKIATSSKVKEQTVRKENKSQPSVKHKKDIVNKKIACESSSSKMNSSKSNNLISQSQKTAPISSTKPSLSQRPFVSQNPPKRPNLPSKFALPNRPGTPPETVPPKRPNNSQLHSPKRPTVAVLKANAPRRPGTPPGCSNSVVVPRKVTPTKPPPYLPQAKRAEIERAAQLRREMMFKHPERFQPVQRRLEDIEDEEDGSDMDSFIDDTEYDDGGDAVEYVDEIRKMFKYDPRRFKHDDDDDPMMESSYGEIQKEEARSARLGMKEDLEDFLREQEELKRKQKPKKAVKRL